MKEKDKKGQEKNKKEVDRKKNRKECVSVIKRKKYEGVCEGRGGWGG